MFWLDGCTIMHYVAPDADTAWALTRSFLHEPHGRTGAVTMTELAEQFAKRQKLDVRQLRPRGDRLLSSRVLCSSRAKATKAQCHCIRQILLAGFVLIIMG